MSLFDFTLKDQDGQDVRFADLKGRKFLLSFHPLAWTPVCAIQMRDLDQRHDQFLRKEITPFGVSIDQLYSKKAWADYLGLKHLRLLSDFWPHGALAEHLGCFIAKNGISGRCQFLIGPEGETVWSKRHEIKEQPDFDAILAELP